MKRLVLILFILLSFASSGLAVDSVFDDYTTRYLDLPGDVDIWVLSWTASDGAAFTTATTRWAVDGYVFMVIVNPGTTAPTGAYDVTLLDSDGMDVMGGQLADLSATVTAQFVPAIGSVYGTRFVRGPLTMTLSGNSVNSANGEIIIYIWGGE